MISSNHFGLAVAVLLLSTQSSAAAVTSNVPGAELTDGRTLRGAAKLRGGRALRDGGGPSTRGLRISFIPAGSACDGTRAPCASDADCVGFTCTSGSAPGVDCFDDGSCPNASACAGGPHDGLSCEDASD